MIFTFIDVCTDFTNMTGDGIILKSAVALACVTSTQIGALAKLAALV
jgi:hypothetical protein